MWQSSNPALTRQDAFKDYYGKSMFAEGASVTTLSGVVNKTGLLVAIAIATGIVGYSVAVTIPSVLWISAIASFIICLGLALVLGGKPGLSPVLAPVYAIVEGFFLGAFTSLADAILESRGLKVFGGVGLQAFIITISAMIAMLALYKARILRPTRTFQAVIVTATGAIMLSYLISFGLAIFTGQGLPLISFGSAVRDTGLMGLLGLGINLLILVVASMWLVIDFKTVEDNVNAGAPRYMEWYCGFALLVTLAWIYFEAVKLVVRLAVLFGGRD